MAGAIGTSHAEKRNSQDLWNLGLTDHPAKPGPVIGNSMGDPVALTGYGYWPGLYWLMPSGARNSPSRTSPG